MISVNGIFYKFSGRGLFLMIIMNRVLKSLIWIFFILMISVINNYSQNLNVADLNLDEFIEKFKETKSFNNKINYMWSGMITEINEKNDLVEVTVIKGKWITKDQVVSYKAILEIKSKDLISMVKNIGLYNKVIFIASIREINSEMVPYCIPSLIKKI